MLTYITLLTFETRVAHRAYITTFSFLTGKSHWTHVPSRPLKSWFSWFSRNSWVSFLSWSAYCPISARGSWGSRLTRFVLCVIHGTIDSMTSPHFLGDSCVTFVSFFTTRSRSSRWSWETRRTHHTWCSHISIVSFWTLCTCLSW